MPSKQPQSPDVLPPPAMLPPPQGVAPVVPAQPSVPAAAPPARRKLPGPPPKLLGEFSADDILLWLESTAFKKRNPSEASGGATGRAAYRARIVDEVRSLKARVSEAQAC